MKVNAQNFEAQILGVAEKIDLMNKATALLKEAERLIDQANQISVDVELVDYANAQAT
ncbi:hypothetical protein FACS1894208_01460 [Clostridia bacterium]|nr:hypothetical protein FACS1894208_01460 [Clostridia bacterium]